MCLKLQFLSQPDREDPAVCFVGFGGWVLRPLLLHGENRGSGCLSKDALDGGRRNPTSFRDLSDALPALTVLLDGDVVQDQRSPADALAFEPCTPHAGAHSFDDQRALELGDGADDHHDSPSSLPSHNHWKEHGHGKQVSSSLSKRKNQNRMEISGGHRRSSRRARLRVGGSLSGLEESDTHWKPHRSTFRIAMFC